MIAKINGKEEKPKPEMDGFASGLAAYSGSMLQGLASQVQIDAGDVYCQRSIPWDTLYLMGSDPCLYLGERALLCSTSNKGIYYLQHPDRRVVATHKRWLWPILSDLARSISKAYAFGVSATALRWTFGDLETHVKREGGRPRRRKVPGFYSLTKPKSLYQGNTQAEFDEEGDLAAIHYHGKRYDRSRALLSIWDPQHEADIRGQGSRVRAHRFWVSSVWLQLWNNRYIERSIDPPRIGRAPAGKVKIGGVEVPATQILSDALMGLKSGGACVIPSQFENGQSLWDIDRLDLGDRSSAFASAHERLDSQKLLACLVPPSSVGLSDANFSGARIPAQQFVEQVQAVCNFIAAEVQKVVEEVHRVNYDESIPAPEVLAYEIPAAKKKLLLEVFKSVVNTPRTQADGRVTTLADVVSEDIVDQLGIPRRELEEAPAVSPAAQAPAAGGRPSEPTGAREERRENAREVEGEDATGAKADKPAPAYKEPKEPKAEKVAAEKGPAAQVFGYHLTAGVVEINEARSSLGLDPVEYGGQTVPEYLATLKEATEPEPETETEGEAATGAQGEEVGGY